MSRTIAAVVLTLWVLFFFDMTLRWVPAATPPKPNLVPVAMMASDFRAGGRSFVVNFVGNIVVFLPIGILLPVATRRVKTASRVGAACAALSAAVEVIQYATGRRVGDVDDVILNTAGGLLGWCVLSALRGYRRRRSDPA